MVTRKEGAAEGAPVPGSPVFLVISTLLPLIGLGFHELRRFDLLLLAPGGLHIDLDVPVLVPVCSNHVQLQEFQGTCREDAEFTLPLPSLVLAAVVPDPQHDLSALAV